MEVTDVGDRLARTVAEDAAQVVRRQPPGHLLRVLIRHANRHKAVLHKRFQQRRLYADKGFRRGIHRFTPSWAVCSQPFGCQEHPLLRGTLESGNLRMPG